MRKINLIMVALGAYSLSLTAQSGSSLKPSKVDFDVFEKLTAEVKEHRKARLVDLSNFLQMAREPDVIILDARSDAMFNSKHIKGAVHLNFSDFTQTNLAATIPSMNSKILIYCNNNIDDDEAFFPGKGLIPRKPSDQMSITLALNIPTYINLYGYGYKNVYELSELVSVFDKRVVFEGTSVSTADLGIHSPSKNQFQL